MWQVQRWRMMRTLLKTASGCWSPLVDAELCHICAMPSLDMIFLLPYRRWPVQRQALHVTDRMICDFRAAAQVLA
jgi:hypothetical protein